MDEIYNYHQQNQYSFQQYNYQNKYNLNKDLEKIKDNENKFDLKKNKILTV